MARQQTPFYFLFKPSFMIAGLLAGLILVLTLTHLTGIYSVVDHIITWRLSTYLHGYSFNKFRYEKGALHIEGLRIPSQEASIEDTFLQSLTIPGSYTDLWAGRLHKIQARGLSLFVKVAEDGSLSVGPVDRLLAEINPNSLNFDELEVQDSTINLVSPLGHHVIKVALELQRSNDLLKATFQTQGLVGLAGSFHKTPHATKIILDVHKAQLFKRPVHISIVINNDPSNLALNFKLRELQTKQNILKAKGLLHLSERKGSLAIEGRAFPLSNFFDLTSLLTYWHSSLISLDGNMAFKGTLTWDGSWTRVQGPMTIQCTQGSLVTSQGKINNFRGTFHFSHLNPLVTPHPLEVEAEQVIINSFLLANAKMIFAFSPQGEFIPTTFSAKTWGGEINAYSFRPLKDLRDGSFCELYFKDIRLENLIALMAISDFKINTVIQGHASLALEKETLQLQSIEFHSTTPQGLLQYFSAPLPQDRQSLQGDQLAFEVLRDLHLTRLEGKIYHNPQVVGEFKAEVKLAGFNPEVLQGYPFEFNLIATGALRELVQNTLRNLQSPRELKDILRLVPKPENRSH